MQTRRAVLFGGMLTVVTGACGVCHAQNASPTGCAIPQHLAQAYLARTDGGQVFQTGNEQIIPRSERFPQVNRPLAQSLGLLANMFEVLPTFAFYNDHEGANAKALPHRLRERTDGTVLFGNRFLASLLDRPVHGDASVVAVCAHEFGHIIGHKRGYNDQLAPDLSQPYRAEQFADFVAGYFAGRRRLDRPDFPAVAFATTFRDHGGRTRGSHGTGDERGAAVQEGFLAAYTRRLGVDDAMEAGFEYAMARI